MMDVQNIKIRRLSVTLRIGVICFILPTISAATLGLTSPPGPANKCETDNCKVARLETAAMILKYHDEKTEPCNNFFKHVCGNYDKSDLILDYDYIESMKEIVKDEMIGEEMEWVDKSPVYKLVHDFYTVCMDDNARGEKAWETLKSKIKSISGWPVKDGDRWKADDFDWVDFIGKAKKEGYDSNIFVDWVPKKTMDDEKPTLTHSLQMASSLFDAAVDPTEELHRNIYNDLMFRMAIDLGVTDVDVQKEIDAAIDFEYALYNISQDTTYDPKNMTVEEMQKEFPSVDWAKFVEKTLTPFLDSDDKPNLKVKNRAALKKFLDLMEKTPKNVQVTYAIWKVIQFTLPFLSGKYAEMLDEYHDILNHPSKPREAFCDEMTINYADLAVERYYLDHFDSSKDTIAKMFSLIKEKMIEMIKESKTLSEDQKKEGVKIMEAMKHTVGSSEKLADLHELEKFYEDAKVTMDNFLQTVLDMNVFKMEKKNSQKLREEEFKFKPGTYMMTSIPQNFQNHLYIPINMIPHIMFENDQPMYMNFGAAGSIMASKMFESVAHLGKKKADDGTMVPSDHYQCFLDIGQNVTDSALKESFVETTVDDVIAQYTGFKAAYQAYQKYVAESGPEMALPEVPYTIEQLFWISWTHLLCFTNKADIPWPNPAPDVDLNVIEYIMMIVLRNVPEISADFNCPAGSFMNFENRCTWW